MATAVTSLPVTTVTADDVQAELRASLLTDFPDWTDQQASNNMIALIETLSALFELEYGYVNRLARECFIQFALDPNNVLGHARGLGYIPQFQSPSTVTAVIQSSVAVTADTVIPAGTQFTCSLNCVYETVADVVIRAGQTSSAPVVLAQRVSNTDNFTGSGSANQSFVLSQSNVMPASLVVTINGDVWTFVPNFVNNLATDKVFSWSMDGSGNCTILFGNGICGKNPPLNAASSVGYQTGGGSTTSVPAGGLGACLSTVNDAGNDAQLNLNAYNAAAAVPGADAETTAQIKANAIANFIAPTVLLTRQDVQNAVSTFPGVQLATAVNWEIVSTLPHNQIQVFIMPVGGGAPSDGLIAAVLNYLTNTKQMVMGVVPSVFGPTYATLDFTMTLGVLPGYSAGQVQNAITLALVNMFNPSVATPGFSLGFGQEVFISQIEAVLQQIPGVRNIDISTPVDTPLTYNQFPVLGTVAFA